LACFAEAAPPGGFPPPQAVSATAHETAAAMPKKTFDLELKLLSMP
jgi:hypothetical protein